MIADAVVVTAMLLGLLALFIVGDVVLKLMGWDE